MSNCIITNRSNPYKIGDCFFTTTNDNPADRFGGIWSKLTDTIAYGPVVGSGKSLALSDGSNLYGIFNNSSGFIDNRVGAFGKDVGSTNIGTGVANQKTLGVATKDEILDVSGATLDYSGLIADTISIKIWVKVG